MWLGIDTSGSNSSIALLTDHLECVREFEQQTSRHAETLLPSVEALFEQTSTSLGALCGVAVGRGPGSFAGLRAGLATAHGLARALNIPLRTVPSSYARAWQLWESDARTDGRHFAVLTASHGALFFLCSLHAKERSLFYEGSFLVRGTDVPTWDNFDTLCVNDSAQLQYVPSRFHSRVRVAPASGAACARAAESFLRAHPDSGHEPVYARGPID